MRHRKQTKKLGRSTSHRKALLASLVCNFIDERRIRTTLPKAKQARSLAERMVTLAKEGTLAARRAAVAVLRRKQHVAVLFRDIAPQFKDRSGGYTRILKLGRRPSDGSEMAVLEWVNIAAVDRRKKQKTEKTEKTEKKEGGGDAEKKT